MNRVIIRPKKQGKGFSLIESLISLFLFLLVVLFSLEIFNSVRTHFLQLKEKEESDAAAYSALDKMREDLLKAGLGLITPLRLGVLQGVQAEEDTLIVFSREEEIFLESDLTPGQSTIPLESTNKINKGREICIFDSKKGEIHTVSSIDLDSITLSSSLNFQYTKRNAHLLLLKKYSFFLDRDNNILRRKVNSSSSQPLLEDVASFTFAYDESSNLAFLQLSLTANQEKTYEISIFPKNLALVSTP